MLATVLRPMRAAAACVSLPARAEATGQAAPRRRAERSRVPKGPTAGRFNPERALGTSSAAGAAAAAATEQQQQQEQEHPHHHLRLLSRYRALLLDSTYRPVGVANWQRAICLDLTEKAEVLEYYESTSVRSVQQEFFLPAVLRVRRHRANPMKLGRVTLNRSNLLLRDSYSCQYCGSTRDLTIDHVVPQSKGGLNTWDNLVTCCSSCNSRKGDKSLEQLRWKLRQQPKEPSTHEMEFLLAMLLGSSISQESLPAEWSNYILPFTRKAKKQQQKQQHSHDHSSHS